MDIMDMMAGIEEKALVTVYETTDYKAFKEKAKADPALVAMLVESFRKKEILNPIMVNQYMEILTGQARFEAWRRLRLPVQFVICDEL